MTASDLDAPMTQSFSERHGYQISEPDITIREEAPADLRSYLVDAACATGYSEHDLRRLAFEVLRVPADPDAWSPAWVGADVRNRLDECDWFQVYDVIEALCTDTTSNIPVAVLNGFARDMNWYFRANGIGWQIVDGKVEVRGAEMLERNLRGALNELEATHRNTAFGELSEAVRDLSRRPEPDVTGAIQHAATAMECVARDATGDSNATLGAILKHHGELIPKPLDVAVDKAWGYASDRARHMREGETPSHREAELIVAISSAVIRYLVRDEVT